MSVAEYLRYQRGLTGTKVVCAEGDCGACTILVSRLVGEKLTPYKSINSCISFMYLMDRCHIITVEGLSSKTELHPVQEKMIEHHGAQCGYCTPGFICAMANMTEDLKKSGNNITSQKVKNYLSGNLCRCTGYAPIIEAGTNIEMSKVKQLSELYQDSKIEEEFNNVHHVTTIIEWDGKEVFLPGTFREVVSYKAEYKDATLTSGATDLGVLQNKNKLSLSRVLSLNNLTEAYNILETKDSIEVGAKVSLTEVEKFCENHFPEFSRMLHIFASPQIKNKGTLVGNLVNASPIGDTIPFLMVAQAEVVLVSSAGMRFLNINQFYKNGYKKLDLRPNEFVFKVLIPKTQAEFKLYKVSIRKDLDISTVTMAAKYELENDVIKTASFAFGGVGPKVLRAEKIEKAILNKKLDKKLIYKLADLVKEEISPLSDHRGSKEFRVKLCQNLMLKFGDEVFAKLSSSNDHSQVEVSI